MELDRGQHLMVRQRGETVKALHAELKTLGYVVAGDETDRAFYGQSTKDMVVKLQEDNALRVSGIVDKITAAKMTELASG